MLKTIILSLSHHSLWLTEYASLDNDFKKEIRYLYSISMKQGLYEKC